MPSPVTPIVPPYYLIVNSAGTASLSVAPFQAAGPLMQVVLQGQGLGYTPGTTYNVALTGGTGSGAQASILVTGNVVTAVTITNNGTGYAISDILSVPGGTNAASVIVTYLPSAGSTLELSGANALNWGANLWESLYRLTENFAAPTAPGANTILGSNITPLQGQLWFNTSLQTLSVYTSSGWTTLETSGITAVDVTAPIVASTSGGIVSLSFANSGVTAGTYTNANISIDAFGRVTSATNGTSGNPGTVTSVTSSNGGIIVSNPTTAVTLDLNAQLQQLAALTSQGFVVRSGTSYTIQAGLTSGQITSGLGYTPYNAASNSAGYITGNQNITLSGDVTGSGTTSIVTTLANSGATAGTYGNSTTVPSIAVNAKGIITGVSQAAIPTFAGSTPGLVPTSPGGTSNVLLANGTWGTPPGTILTAALSANQEVTNGTYSVSSLLIALQANSYYAFKMFIWVYPYADPCYIAPIYTGTQQIGFWSGIVTDPGGAFVYNSGTGFVGSITTAGGAPINGTNALVIDQSPTGIIIDGSIVTGTAGNLAFKFGPYGSGNGSYAYLKQGSWMTVTKLNAV